MVDSNFVVLVMVVLTSLSCRTGLTAPAEAPGAEENVPDGVLKSCKNKPADIYFLMDCSSSVWIVDFEKQKEFVVSIIERLDIGPNATRVGLGVFSSDFYHVLDIGDYHSKDILIRFVRSAPYLSGNTYTGKAIHGLRTHGFRQEIIRPNASKIGIVITDGKSRHRINTIIEARKAREDQGIWMFAVGVGDDVDQDELHAISSVPKRLFSFHVASFDILTTLTTTLAVSSCSLVQPQSDGAACGHDSRGDVMFLYNAGATGNHDLRLLEDFVAHVVGQFSMATGKIRVGVVSKGCQGSDISLDQFLRPEKLITALREEPKGRLAPLFKQLRLKGFDIVHGGRSSVANHIIAFVDDVLHDRDDVLYESLLLKYSGVKVHVVTLGHSVSLEEMKQVASSPDDIFGFSSYSDLQSPDKRRAFLDRFCAAL